jgi:hypothetical protein
MLSDRVLILGDVDEVQERRKGADNQDRLLRAQWRQTLNKSRRIKMGRRTHRRDGFRAHLFDQSIDRFALQMLQVFPKKPTEKPNVFPKRTAARICCI